MKNLKTADGNPNMAKKLFDPITRAAWQGFEKMQMKTKVKVNDNCKDISHST